MQNKPNTGQEIKRVAKDLFNKKGIPSVTLREVAKTMNKSYFEINFDATYRKQYF
ncbi:hypothetical protein Fleli_1286 [Bernardetia litoralis DSM 6794]|uniref:HTH tetR-type domain-containing protein n=1 Tax=Bernardetia litoralis (strain ATCC 23117 / DSM 6794 / NBRC 15988 / NCIMB 1366 / Fx l1 / Sio-4) TaxID=880071 RepID=I4AID5_BERLS|nr:hypothetical protein [Bernardetia litoralis]AFM03720.1 hypothetical protein Fleli_1286 [Bernardetia litoralis DSM 6794]